jgi:hypothetical protein
MPTEPNDTIYGVAAAPSEPEWADDVEYHNAMMAALRTIYPNVEFEHPGSNAYNWRVNGLGATDVSHLIDYEALWDMDLDELTAIVGAAS